MDLTQIARECRAVVDRAKADLGQDYFEKGGHSMLDLVADNLPYALKDLEAALALAGLRKAGRGAMRRARKAGHRIGLGRPDERSDDDQGPMSLSPEGSRSRDRALERWARFNYNYDRD